MGLNINTLNLKKAQSRLSNSQKAYKRVLVSEMAKLAKVAQRMARAMAPMETGSLENAIFARVVKNGYDSLHIELKVDGSRPRESVSGVYVRPGTTVGDYALYMEKNKYNLQARSVVKQMLQGPVEGRRVNVGRRYIERAVEYIRKQFPEIVENSAKKAGFARRR
ncbi:TPA: hypothetical protein ACTYZB_004794 [Klebsiella variicola]